MDYQDLVDTVQEHDDSLNELSDNLDTVSDNFDQYTTDNDQNVSDLQQNSGQLTFPLSQDTIDLITEQSPAIIKSLFNGGYIGTITLVAGTATLLSNFITTTSLILLTVATTGGTRGALSYVPTAGQAVITSTSNTDTSTLIYFILT